MKSELTKIDIEDFYIRIYFNLELGLINAAIKRAYLDFCRTLKILPKNEELKTELVNNLTSNLHERIIDLLDSKFQTQDEFDNWHQKSCISLMVNSEDENVFNGLAVGQAQKWVNMSLKYLFAFGENRVKNISVNYQYFHIPIDNIIQNKLWTQFGIKKFPVAWSRINSYEEYIQYQIEFRESIQGQTPMDVEFRLFNIS